MKQFKTIQEALAAGYRKPQRGVDTDTSGHDSFGYRFTSADGQKTVTVSLTEERNQIGGQGAYLALFPPTVSA